MRTGFHKILLRIEPTARYELTVNQARLSIGTTSYST